ncbi:MAG TPA: hypothetical protein VF741_01640 [Candidatus Aquilonibacter sp.]|jgi:hypothetical protein
MTFVVTLFICAAIAVLGIYFQVRYNARSVMQGPALLTMLGIAGTFLGIAVGLSYFNPNDIQGSIPGLINGMKTSVWASFVGVFFAILLKLRYALAREDDAASGDKSDAELIVDELRTLQKLITRDADDMTVISQIKLSRSEIAHRLEALKESQAELMERLIELNRASATR